MTGMNRVSSLFRVQSGRRIEETMTPKHRDRKWYAKAGIGATWKINSRKSGWGGRAVGVKFEGGRGEKEMEERERRGRAPERRELRGGAGQGAMSDGKTK